MVEYKVKNTNFIQVRNITQVCQNKNHIQQIAYSSYHDTLTQVCFTCKMIRTNMDKRIVKH